MGLELRRGRDGQLLPHWYGRIITDGRSWVVNLNVPMVGEPPPTLLEKGNDEFEASREKARDAFKREQDKARRKGRDSDLAARIIEIKTGRKWTSTKIEVLPELIRAEKHRRPRSPQHETWKIKTVQNFVNWAREHGVRTTLDVSPELAKAYIATFYEPDEEQRIRTAESIRKIKAIVGNAVSRALPEGVENPFKYVIVETPDGDRVFNREPLNAAEVERLLEVTADDRTAFELIVTGLSTGLRRGDACRLRWESVNLRDGVLKLTTSKTRAELYLPIMPRLRTVLQGRLAERQEGEDFVFPEAEQQLRTNPSGVSWRIKRAFALAFAKPPEAQSSDADELELVPLPVILPKVLDAVRAATMNAGKREKMIDLLNRYASGQSYRVIQQERHISRGGISMLLHEAQKLAKIRFLADAQVPGINAAIRDVTREKRAVGLKSASKYDFHGLRTTFVTLALNAGINVDKLKALTGHHTVEVVLKHYFKPRGTDVAGELEAALPAVLTGRQAMDAKPAELPEHKGDRVTDLAAQLKGLTKPERARLMKLIGGES